MARTPTATTVAGAVLAAGVLLAGCGNDGPAGSADAPREISYVLLPHPDDEFQVWSQLEDREDSYTVFVLLTRGEQSTYCDSETGGGRWTDTCAEARLASWTGFFAQMGEHDPTLPASFPEDPETVSDLDTDGVDLGRDDDGTVVVNPDALVWHDAQDRGALIAFDLGDGDLSAEEAGWAVGQVLADPGAFGLVPQAPDRVLGAYYYPGEESDCFPYPHPDHAAVAEVIATAELAPEQSFATCAADPSMGEVRESPVSEAAAEAAFGSDGAFPEHYGWLGGWALDREGQGELFHVPQSFTAGGGR